MKKPSFLQLILLVLLLLPAARTFASCAPLGLPNAVYTDEPPTFYEAGVPFTLSVGPPAAGWPSECSVVGWDVSWQSATIIGSLRQEFTIPANVGRVAIRGVAGGPQDAEGCYEWLSSTPFVYLVPVGSTPSPSPTPTPPIPTMTTIAPPTPCLDEDYEQNIVYPRPNATDIPSTITLTIRNPSRLISIEPVGSPDGTPVPLVRTSRDTWLVSGLVPFRRYLVTMLAYVDCNGEGIGALYGFEVGTGTTTPTPSPTPSPIPHLNGWLLSSAFSPHATVDQMPNGFAVPFTPTPTPRHLGPH